MRTVAISLFWIVAVLAFAFATLLLAPELIGRVNDKVLHACVFAFLALLGGLAYPRVSVVTVFAWLAAFGGLIELVQLIPALGRDCDWRDWLVDCLAAGCALSVVWCLRRALRSGKACLASLVAPRDE